MAVVLQGKLSAFRLYDLLTLLNLSASSGTLIIKSAEREASVLFERGTLKFARSNEPRLRLGNILEIRGDVTGEEAERIDRAMLADGGKFGETAVRLGICTSDRVTESLKIQVSEIIYAAFLWEKGDFVFDDVINWPEWAVTISVDLSNLIMEGARRIDEWNECVALLPDDRVVFRVVNNPEVQGKINLSLDEWGILYEIDGVRSLKVLLEQTGHDPLGLYRVVYGLMASKLIEPVTSDRLATMVQGLKPDRFDGDSTNLLSRAETLIRHPKPEDDTRLVVSRHAIPFDELRDTARLVGRLRIQGPEDEESVVVLRDEEYLIGRTSKCQVRVNDTTVSAVHARFYRTDHGYAVEDLQSRNGVFVNGTTVTTRILRHGDAIHIGALDLDYSELYDIPEDELPAAVVPPGAPGD